MSLILLAYLGGVLTIVSPCILPVLPFVFSRTGAPFARSGLPLLAGMALSFTAVASLAAVGGGWAVAANQYGRWVALVLVALFALALLWPGLAGRLARPLVAAGDRLSQRAQADGGAVDILGVGRRRTLPAPAGLSGGGQGGRRGGERNGGQEISRAHGATVAQHGFGLVSGGSPRRPIRPARH